MKHIMVFVLCITLSYTDQLLSQQYDNSVKMSYLFTDNVYRNPTPFIIGGSEVQHIQSSSAIKLRGGHSAKFLWEPQNHFNKKKPSWTKLYLNYELRAYRSNPKLNTFYLDFGAENRRRWTKGFVSKAITNVSIKRANPNLTNKLRRVVPFAYRQYELFTTQDLELTKNSRLWIDAYYKLKNYIHRSSLDRIQYGTALRFRYRPHPLRKNYWRLSATGYKRYYLNQAEKGVFDGDSGVLANPSDQRVFTHLNLSSSVEIRDSKTAKWSSGLDLGKRWHNGSGRLSYYEWEGYVSISKELLGFNLRGSLSIEGKIYYNYFISQDESLRSLDRKISFSISKQLKKGLVFSNYISLFSRTSNNPTDGSLFFDGYNVMLTSMSIKYTL